MRKFVRKLERALTLETIPNAFHQDPLRKEDSEFYYGNTMIVRTGNPYDSPIEDIFDACVEQSEENAFLLLGHRGCGKSTELNYMSERLEGNGHPVRTIMCGDLMNLLDPETDDLLILMADALLNIAKDKGVFVDPKTSDTLLRFWREESVTWKTVDGSKINIEAGADAEAKLFSLAELSASLKSKLKFNEETARVFRGRVKNNSAEWVAALENVAARITDKQEGCQPIMIFEDLDKLDPENAWKVFYGRASTLAGFSFPVIYTFPIALSYDPKFGTLGGYFTTHTLPMIKLKNIDDSRNQAGYDAVLKIIKLRADRERLFEENALEWMIQQTGGSLRDLFRVINDCSRTARRRNSRRIEMEDAKLALTKLSGDLTRRFSGDQYKFLKEIYEGNRKDIKDQNTLLLMLQAGAVLEYNGERWHNLHPLVAEYLRELGYVQ